MHSEQTTADTTTRQGRKWGVRRVLSLLGVGLLGGWGIAGLFTALGYILTLGGEFSDTLIGLFALLAFPVWIVVAVVLFRQGRDRLGWKITMWTWIAATGIALAAGLYDGITGSN